MLPAEVILKRFESPDEVRQMELGRFEIVRIGGMTIGRATYQPGWRWSTHVGPGVGASHCTVEHVGLVVAGTATAALRNGDVIHMHAGDVFYIPPEPHDSWVVGDEPYVSLHFLGADHYATTSAYAREGARRRDLAEAPIEPAVGGGGKDTKGTKG
jgi:quercetin dioxygenase-like cupin family protein